MLMSFVCTDLNKKAISNALNAPVICNHVPHSPGAGRGIAGHSFYFCFVPALPGGGGGGDAEV